MRGMISSGSRGRFIQQDVGRGGRWRRAYCLLLARSVSGATRVYRHHITLSPTDTIVLADADNQTGDPVFDDALNIALRYEMAQTPLPQCSRH